MTVGSLKVFFGKMSIQVFCLFFNQVVCLFFILSCISCFCILNINPLSVVSLANIFSHSVGCLFILWMVFFAVQKLLSLIRSHLFIFAFVSFALGDRSKNIYIATIYVKRVFCLYFLLGVCWFPVLCLCL